ncbi:MULTISPECIES: ParA family protein [Legionella]|uniref:ParA family protein n=1 Tax=Legionella TaxID=445 RepID=UPI001040ED0D|nr:MULTISPECIES: ParA family protein [Legionella]
MEPKMLVSEAAEALGVTAQALHNQIKRKNLAHEKSRNRVYFGHQTAKELLGLNFSSQVLCFQIVKGGTGKTSMCLALGVRASLYGAKTLLIDLDQQGNLTKACRVSSHETPIMIEIINQELSIEDGILTVYEGLDILPSRIENALLDSNLMLKRLPLDRIYKEMIAPLKSKYDLIIIDCPPALGSSVTAAALASDRIVAPVTPSEFSLEGLEITKQEIKNIEKNFHTKLLLCPLLNEFDVRTSLSHETMKFLMTNYEKTLIRSVIRKSQEFENVLTKGESIYDSLNLSPAREDVDLLTRELLNISVLQDKETSDASKKTVEKKKQAVPTEA